MSDTPPIRQRPTNDNVFQEAPRDDEDISRFPGAVGVHLGGVGHNGSPNGVLEAGVNHFLRGPISVRLNDEEGSPGANQLTDASFKAAFISLNSGTECSNPAEIQRRCPPGAAARCMTPPANRTGALGGERSAEQPCRWLSGTSPTRAITAAPQEGPPVGPGAPGAEAVASLFLSMRPCQRPCSRPMAWCSCTKHATTWF